MIIESQIHHSTVSVEDAKFKNLAQKLSVLLASEKVYVRTFDKGLPHFSKLTEQRKFTINQHLEFYYELCREQMSEGYTLKDSSSFLWRALSRLSLVPRSDLFQYITSESVFEIYSSDNVQLFRNLNFFKYCSYTLEELHSREWWLLFDRDPKITDIIYGYAAQIFSGEQQDNFVPDIPKHIVRELESSDKLVMEVQFEMMGPLYQNKRAEALIVAELPVILSN